MSLFVFQFMLMLFGKGTILHVLSATMSKYNRLGSLAFVCICPFPPPLRAGCDIMFIFKRSTTDLNSELSFTESGCHTKIKESLLYYLQIAEGKIVRYIPFSKVLVPREMQTDLSSIWTRVVRFISSDDNHYATGIFKSASALVRQLV